MFLAEGGDSASATASAIADACTSDNYAPVVEACAEAIAEYGCPTIASALAGKHPTLIHPAAAMCLQLLNLHSSPAWCAEEENNFTACPQSSAFLNLWRQCADTLNTASLGWLDQGSCLV